MEYAGTFGTRKEALVRAEAIKTKLAELRNPRNLILGAPDETDPHRLHPGRRGRRRALASRLLQAPLDWIDEAESELGSPTAP